TRHRSLIEPLLKDQDPVVQQQAASALGQLGARSAVPTLTAVVGEKGEAAQKDLSLGVTVAEALDKLGDPLGAAILKRAVKAKDPSIQVRAALLLTEKG